MVWASPQTKNQSDFRSRSHLEVRHEHEVPRLVPVVVDGVVVDVEEDGVGAQAVGVVLGVDHLAEAVKDLQARLLLRVELAL